MIYKRFQDKDLSLLGFGTMRLPVFEDGKIDVDQVDEMVKYALEHGINYFDTAMPYHNGLSEKVIGECLKKYPRDSFYLADKYPGHQTVAHFDPAKTFQTQLDRCQVDYFDFYLMHNVSEYSLDNYLSDELGFVKYFLGEKERGRIKHLGFSCHGNYPCLKAFLDKYADVMEFCQLQINYVDWDLQGAKEKYELVSSYGIPVWVMEPLRGGALKNTAEAFRWLERFDNIKMILSGMSNMNQLMENVAIFHAEDPLSDLDTNGLKLLADKFVTKVPCTSCHYCDGCPKGIDIPVMMNLCTDARTGFNFSITMRIEGQPEGSRMYDCVECGACVPKCPQHINIPEIMKELNERWEKMPHWADVCKQREEAQKQLEAAEALNK